MLHDKLNMLKEAKKMTVNQIAELSGVPVSTVSRILSGQTADPGFQTVCDIVRAMGGSLDYVADFQPKGQTDWSRVVEIYEKTIATKNEWIKRLFILSSTFAIVFIFLLVADFVNGGIGFIHY